MYGVHYDFGNLVRLRQYCFMARIDIDNFPLHSRVIRKPIINSQCLVPVERYNGSASNIETLGKLTFVEQLEEM